MLSVDFFKKNRNKLANELKDNSIAILFSGVAPKKSLDEQYPFAVNRNFYYETGINEDAEQNVGVYPNPANEKITIEAQNIESVSITNVMGQKVYETSVNDDNMVIDVNDFPAGIYMIHVITDEYEATKRVSIVH